MLIFRRLARRSCLHLKSLSPQFYSNPRRLEEFAGIYANLEETTSTLSGKDSVKLYFAALAAHLAKGFVVVSDADRTELILLELITKCQRLAVSEILKSLNLAKEFISTVLIFLLALYPAKITARSFQVFAGLLRSFLEDLQVMGILADPSLIHVASDCYEQLVHPRGGLQLFRRLVWSFDNMRQDSSFVYEARAAAHLIMREYSHTASLVNLEDSWVRLRPLIVLRPFREHAHGGLGWENTGNTCFIAACVNAFFLSSPVLAGITQCLFNYSENLLQSSISAPLVFSLTNCEVFPSRSCESYPGSLAFGWELLSCLVNAHLSDRRSLNLTRLTELCPIGLGASQEDVCELLLWTLNYFATLESPTATREGSSGRGQDCMTTSTGENNSRPVYSRGGMVIKVSDLFRLRQTTLLKCNHCERQRCLNEEAFVILLAVPSEPEQLLETRSNATTAKLVGPSSPCLRRSHSSPATVSSPPELASPETSVLDLQSETSSLTTRGSSLTEVSTDIAISETPPSSQEVMIGDTLEEEGGASKVLVMSSLYLERMNLNVVEETSPKRRTRSTTSPRNLAELMDSYLKYEILADYTCDSLDFGCGELGGAGRKIVLGELPPILTIVLNRFKHEEQSSKITTPVTVTRFLAVPFSALGDGHGVSLSSSALSSRDATVSVRRGRYKIYELYAVIVHTGSSADSGHYKVVGTPIPFADLDRAVPEWFSFDDQRIQPVDSCILDRLSKSSIDTPYVLFYESIPEPQFAHKMDDDKPVSRSFPVSSSSDHHHHHHHHQLGTLGGDSLEELWMTMKAEDCIGEYYNYYAEQDFERRSVFEEKGTMAASSDDNDNVSSIEKALMVRLGEFGSSPNASSPERCLEKSSPALEDLVGVARPVLPADPPAEQKNLFIAEASLTRFSESDNNSSSSTSEEADSFSSIHDAVVPRHSWDWTCVPLTLTLETLVDNLLV